MLRPLHPDDTWLFAEGRHTRLAEVLGAEADDTGGRFAVWAPRARAVSVVGDWQSWDLPGQPLEPGPGGIWTGTDPGARPHHRYKYAVTGADGVTHLKADPMARHAEEPPGTASVLWGSGHVWGDDDWLASRPDRRAETAPMSIYEVHLGSWRLGLDGDEPLYRAVAEPLADHVERLGFTHVEFLPLTEFPFGGSWGYQATGYFTPTCRYGSPDDFRALVDSLHQRGIGVIVDWVPSHFPADAHALATFDGEALYEHPDPRKGYHPDWHSLIFDYGRGEVRSFLVSSAAWWAEQFHVDGIRVDAVASMLYLDYSRNDGEWIPNRHGGNEHLEAIEFLRTLTEALDAEHPDVAVIAEESTAWPGVTGDRLFGGLGFDWKWDMGWMHDTLEYVERAPIHRRYHHDDISRRALWADTERFVLPLSHDEVVHGKGSLLDRCPGDDWQRLATLRLLLGTMWATPGKKLLFMGAELAQEGDWSHDGELPWSRLDDPAGAGTTAWLGALNGHYRSEPSLHVTDHDPAAFSWLVLDDTTNSTYAWVRAAPGARPVVAVANWTPTVHESYRIGVPVAGAWDELATSDDVCFGGSGVTNTDLHTTGEAAHGHPQSLTLRLPPLAMTLLAPRGAP